VSDDREFGGIGTKVVYEDDAVRVWMLSLAPGEESPVHRHELDHLLIQVSGDRIAVVPEPDTQGPFTERLEVDVIPGAVVRVPRGGIERAHNVGSAPYLEVIVELKDAL
jgi:predicted metal-dependent enzyme (double-stranded beta helix superfamily)